MNQLECEAYFNPPARCAVRPKIGYRDFKRTQMQPPCYTAYTFQFRSHLLLRRWDLCGLFCGVLTRGHTTFEERSSLLDLISPDSACVSECLSFAIVLAWWFYISIWERGVSCLHNSWKGAYLNTQTDWLGISFPPDNSQPNYLLSPDLLSYLSRNALISFINSIKF